MSIVGSIGVRGGGFGLTDLIARVGVERRMYTAGDEQGAARSVQSGTAGGRRRSCRTCWTMLHRALQGLGADAARRQAAGRRGALFDGSFMLGERALERGLIDGLGDVDALVRKLGGERAVARRFAPRRRGVMRWLPRLAVDAVLDAVEERRWRIEV